MIKGYGFALKLVYTVMKLGLSQGVLYKQNIFICFLKPTSLACYGVNKSSRGIYTGKLVLYNVTLTGAKILKVQEIAFKIVKHSKQKFMCEPTFRLYIIEGSTCYGVSWWFLMT